MPTRAIVKTSGFTRDVCKNIVDVTKLKSFSSGVPREQALLRQSKTPENRQRSGLFCLAFRNAPVNRCIEKALDGRNRAMAITESLARVIAAIRIASVRWRSYLPPNHRA